MANKLSGNIEHGARELENSRPDSKLRNHAVDVALTVSLLSSSAKSSSDLRQFTAKNITGHQRNDTASEKKETKCRQKAFRAEDNRSISVDEKRNLLSERTEIIKSEYGSIRDYNIAKQSPDFVKSERLQDVEFRVAKIDGEIRNSSNKVRKYNEKADVIKTNRGENQSLRSGGKIYDKREVKEANHRRKAFRAEDSRYVAVAGKCDLLRERSEIIKSEYGSIQNYNVAKKSAGFEKSAKLQKIEAKISEFQSDIDKASSKFRQHSGSAEKLLDKRSQSKHFREGGNSLLSDCKTERKAAKADIRLAKAERQITHRVIRKSYKFDSVDGKITKSLVIEKKIKPIDKGGLVSKGLKGAGAVTTMRLSAAIHKEFSKNENDTQNVGAKAAHTAEKFVENAAVKSVQRANKFIHEQPYKRVSKLQMKSDKANAKLYAKRKGGSARQMKKHAKTYMQKAKQARVAKSGAAKAVEQIGAALKTLLKTAGGALGKVMLIALCIVALIMLVLSIVMLFATAIGGKSGSILGLYLSADDEIYAAEQYAQSYEITAVQATINGITSAVNHDVLIINPYTFNRNPYNLISFLSAYSFTSSGDEYDNSFVVNNATKSVIERFINTYYYVLYSTYEVRTTVFYGYDDDGYPIYDEIVTIYLTIDVQERTADEVVQSIFSSGSPYTPEMYDLYLMYMETSGFRDDLYPEWAT